MVEQAPQVGCELSSRIWRWKYPAPPVAAQIGNNHAMLACEMIDYRLEHLASNHQPMDEQKRRPRAALSKGDEL